VELVMVMVLIGILAVYAAPRFNRGAFDIEAARRELAEAFRYAQEMSMAHTGQAGFEVMIKATGDGFLVRQSGVTIADPFGGAYDRSWAGVSITNGGTIIGFDGRGAPSTGAVFTLSAGGDAAPLRVWPETGYVQ
jgi:type II secretory pathway pseudopilin PulG